MSKNNLYEALKNIIDACAEWPSIKFSGRLREAVVNGKQAIAAHRDGAGRGDEHLLRNCIYLTLIGVTMEDGYSLPSAVRQQIEDKIIRRYQSKSLKPSTIEGEGEEYFNKIVKMNMPHSHPKGFNAWLATTEIQKYNEDLWFDMVSNDSFSDLQISEMYVKAQSPQPAVTQQGEEGGEIRWSSHKTFPTGAYKTFVIRYRYPEHEEWEYDVVHTAKMPNHLPNKTWEWLDESPKPSI